MTKQEITDEARRAPEPPDGTALYWPEDADYYARIVIRDDAAAAITERPEARWFRPNVDEEQGTWAEFLALLTNDASPTSAAIVLSRVSSGASP